jgi:hypothetical protein
LAGVGCFGGWKAGFWPFPADLAAGRGVLGGWSAADLGKTITLSKKKTSKKDKKF